MVSNSKINEYAITVRRNEIGNEFHYFFSCQERENLEMRQTCIHVCYHLEYPSGHNLTNLLKVCHSELRQDQYLNLLRWQRFIKCKSINMCVL